MTPRAGACSSYSKSRTKFYPSFPLKYPSFSHLTISFSAVIVDTRGTGEFQGPSVGFITMNNNIRSQVNGGQEYDTVYPAGIDQNSASGTNAVR